jgi:hypothetical protein
MVSFGNQFSIEACVRAPRQEIFLWAGNFGFFGSVITLFCERDRLVICGWIID